MIKNLLITTLTLTSLAGYAKTQKIEVDPATSKLVYLAKKVTGQHTGEVKISNGFLSFDKDTLKPAKFVFKSVKREKADNYKISGDLTIKGKTAPVTFDAVATKEKATAKVVFDRTKYDIKYGSGKFFPTIGDKMINDDVQLDVLLAAKK
jgi:polyisoprenoid-binding protein YceI